MKVFVSSECDNSACALMVPSGCPSDRLAVRAEAQAQLLDATIVTTARKIAAYAVAVLDPRA